MLGLTLPKCQVASEIIDELYDNPQTGDRVVFDAGLTGTMRYERTLIKDGDQIRYEENDLEYTVEQFRSLIINRLNSILAVHLEPRET